MRRRLTHFGVPWRAPAARKGSQNMDWLKNLRSWLLGPDLSLLAEQIAIRCRTAVWQRIEHRMHGLSLAEARGYVRVKAAQVIRQQVDRIMESDEAVRPAVRPQLEELAMEAVLRQAILDVLHARRVQRQLNDIRPVRKAA
jgi:hypothetical protein